MSARDIATTLAEATRIGVTPLEQAIASGLIEEATGFRALAHHLRLPFTAEALPIAQSACWPEAETNGIAPLSDNRHGWRFALAPRGAALRRLIARDGAPPDSGLVVSSPSRLARGFADSFPMRMGKIAADSLPDASPRESCRDGPGACFITVLLGLSFAAAFLLTLDARGALTGATVLLGFFFFINVAMRLAAIGLHRGERDVTAPANDAGLPVYTVLAPLYREAASARRLVAALRALDYPALRSNCTKRSASISAIMTHGRSPRYFDASPQGFRHRKGDGGLHPQAGRSAPRSGARQRRAPPV